MADYKYIGVVLRKDDDSGIASITVRDNTTATDIIYDERLDLFQKDRDATFTKYELLTWVQKVSPADHSYSITVTHTGTHHPSAVGPSYTLQIEGFFTQNLLNEADPTPIAGFWNEIDTVNSYMEYSLTDGEKTSLLLTQTFDGDDIEDTFVLSGNRWAYTPYRFSVDGGSNWWWPGAYQLSWGQNATDYDDSTVDAITRKFGVVFADPPASGTGNVVIEYIPWFTKYKVKHTLKHPNDGLGFKDITATYRLLDFGVDLIP